MYINKVSLKGENEVGGWNNPNKIIIHHPEWYGDIVGLNNMMRTMGYAMVGYNYYVRKDGSIWQARPVHVTSANCYGQNHCSIGICFEGNYEKDTAMPDAQFNSGVELIQYLMKQHNISEVGGHKRYCNTACPGKYFPLDKMINAVHGKSIVNASISYSNTSSNSNQKLWELCVNGEIVKRLQHELNVQLDAGIKEDGWFGDGTLSKCCLVRKGAKGNISKIIQERLIAKGYSVGPWGADGCFGQGTYDAVIKFQRAKGLSADGIVGKNTWKALLKK